MILDTSNILFWFYFNNFIYFYTIPVFRNKYLGILSRNWWVACILQKLNVL